MPGRSRTALIQREMLPRSRTKMWLMRKRSVLTMSCLSGEGRAAVADCAPDDDAEHAQIGLGDVVCDEEVAAAQVLVQMDECFLYNVGVQFICGAFMAGGGRVHSSWLVAMPASLGAFMKGTVMRLDHSSISPRRPAG